MYERKLANHTTKNAVILSVEEDITKSKPQTITLRSYDTIVIDLYHDYEKTIIYALNTFEWSNTTIKHIGWFLKQINSILDTDLCYYDLKFMAIEKGFKLIIEPERSYYYDDCTGEIIIRDSATIEYAAKHKFERREFSKD